ncbi:MAG: chromophore lyase CpcT/CpeT, partial [Bacteroidota bacterium]
RRTTNARRDTSFARWESSVYLLPQPEDFIMKWKSPQAFEVLSKEDLSLREGCSVFLTSQKDGSFAGSTQGQDCASELRGASYASSKVSITTSKIESWDQGFDTSGAQVWGATTGGYVFDRLK